MSNNSNPRSIALNLVFALPFSLLGFSGCASSKPLPEFTTSPVGYPKSQLEVQVWAQLSTNIVFFTEVYILNRTDEVKYLDLDGIQLIDGGSVLARRLCPDDVANLFAMENSWVTPAQEFQLRTAADAGSLRESRIPPRAAIQGKVFWLAKFRGFPLYFSFAVGEDRFQFVIEPKGQQPEE